MMMTKRHALKHMKEGSCIINTTSVNAYKGNASLLDYTATKGAIVAFTRGLALQLVGRGIRVNGTLSNIVYVCVCVQVCMYVCLSMQVYIYMCVHSKCGFSECFPTCGLGLSLFNSCCRGFFYQDTQQYRMNYSVFVPYL